MMSSSHLLTLSISPRAQIMEVMQIVYKVFYPWTIFKFKTVPKHLFGRLHCSRRGIPSLGPGSRDTASSLTVPTVMAVTGQLQGKSFSDKTESLTSVCMADELFSDV